MLERLGSIDLPAALTDKSEYPTWWRWLFAMGGALASHTAQVSAILKDPITGLPDRAGFQAVLAEELEKARLNKSALSLILVNPDDFAAINERFGRVAGDNIVREISGRLRSALRGSDPLARYGGVIFAITLADTNLEAARGVAEKLIRSATEGAFLDGAVRLGFSAGVAVFEYSDEEIGHHLDLIRRADQALNAAKRVGGGVVIDWESDNPIEPEVELYASPINLSPEAPPTPVSAPGDASAELAEGIGRYYTQGMAEDVNALAAELAELNNIPDVRDMRVGQPIRVPFDLLLPEFLPADDPRRVEYEKDRTESDKQFLDVGPRNI